MTARSAILITTGIATAASAGLLWFLLKDDAPQFTLALLAVHAGLFAVCAFAIVWFTRVPMDRIEEIAEGLRLISSGRRDGRLDAASFGELRIIASAHNTLAAALSERDDPNLGPVRVSEKQLPYQKSSDDVAVGVARRISEGPRNEAKLSKAREEKAREEKAREEKAREEKAREEKAREEKAREEKERKASMENQTLIGHASAPPTDKKPQRPKRRRKKKRKARPETTQEWEQRSQPTIVENAGLSDEDVKSLFADFATALGDDDAPTFGEFEAAIHEQHKALLQAHQCKDVRFEVTTVEGEVSLLPRLIR